MRRGPQLSPIGEPKQFPPTGAPILIIQPPRQDVPPYAQPRATIAFLPPKPVPVPGPLPPPRPGPGPIPPPPPVTYLNTEQSCDDVCPGGTTGETITATVPAGTYSSEVSQAAANALAHAAACALAAAEREETPCVPDSDEPSIVRECRTKTGNVDCIPDTYGSITAPVNYSGSGTTAPSCGDLFGFFAQAMGTANPIAIDPAGDAGFGTVTYRLGTTTWLYGPIFSLGCGTSTRIGVAMQNFPDTAFFSGGIIPGATDIILSKRPAYQPYKFLTFVDYSLGVGQRVSILESIMYIDLRDVVFTGCIVAVQNFVDDPDNPWVPVSCSSLIASLLTVDDETVQFSHGEVRVNIGSPVPLVIGTEYRVTFTYSRRDIGSSDPFVVIGETSEEVFTADATTHVTDWFAIPNSDGFETKVANVTIEVVI